MRFVEPSVEYWPQGPGMSGMWSQIARVARLSYDAQPREGETDAQYVERVILKPSRKADGTYDFDKQHGGVLEFGTVYLTIPEKTFGELYIVCGDIDALTENNWINKYKFYGYYGNRSVYHITTNLRFLLEHELFDICKKFIVDEPTEHYRRYCFHVTTDIGVSREWNRHRASMSINEQSTRFVDYSKDRHGGELTFVRPQWITKEDLSAKGFSKDVYSLLCPYEQHLYAAESSYYQLLCAAEDTYKRLRECGWRPEQARQVLPLNTKTEVAYCAYEDSWRHFIRLRGSRCVSGKAHPNIMPLADEIERKLDELTKL